MGPSGHVLRNCLLGNNILKANINYADNIKNTLNTQHQKRQSLFIHMNQMGWDQSPQTIFGKFDN